MYFHKRNKFKHYIKVLVVGKLYSSITNFQKQISNWVILQKNIFFFYLAGIQYD